MQHYKIQNQCYSVRINALWSCPDVTDGFAQHILATSSPDQTDWLLVGMVASSYTYMYIYINQEICDKQTKKYANTKPLHHRKESVDWNAKNCVFGDQRSHLHKKLIQYIIEMRDFLTNILRNSKQGRGFLTNIIGQNVFSCVLIVLFHQYSF